MMSTEAKKQVVKKLLGELAAGNLDGFFACLTPDATWQVMGKPEKFALAGKRNMAEMRTLLAGVSGSLETPLTVTPIAFTCDGDRVAVEATSHADLKNGRAYRNAYHFLMEFRDGKIASVREYLDTLHAKEILVDP
jgi:ketosteroid isomerase-like protein